MRKFHQQVFTIVLSLFLLLPLADLFAQQPSVYLFIEPNISIRYDSNLFGIVHRYSNTSWGNESYDFEYKPDTFNKVSIHIAANIPVDYPPKKIMDSLMLASMEDTKASENDTFGILTFDKAVRDINGFSCVGFVGYSKTSQEYGSVIDCLHFSDGEYTEVKLISANKKSLEPDYELLKQFLSAFKVYSRAEIAREEKLIQSRYSVVVLPTRDTAENFRYRPKTFAGIIKIKQQPGHTIKEMELSNDFMKEIFPAASNGTVSFICNDNQKGKIIKKGELVLLNSFGRKMKLPFSFTYVNKGKL
jgi:hypothetical protein